MLGNKVIIDDTKTIKNNKGWFVLKFGYFHIASTKKKIPTVVVPHSSGFTNPQWNSIRENQELKDKMKTQIFEHFN